MRTTADIAGVKPFITGILYLNNGSTKVITNADLKTDTFTIESGTSNTNEFTVGACVIGGLNFTLLNDTGKFSDLDWYNSKVAIKLSYDDDVELDYDDYFVVKHHEIGKLINVECYDALKVLDEYNLYELTQNYGLSFPCAVHQVLTALSTQHGFTFTGCTGINIQLEDPNNDQMTQRALLAYIAQLCGQYVKAYGTELRFGWYNLNNATHVGTTFSHDLRTDDITITGVKLTTYDDEETAELGSGNNPIEIDDNPFITKTNINTVASTIYSAIGSGTFTYRPGDVSIISNAAIEAGDVLLVNTGEEKNIKVLATNITYKPQLQESISSDADPYAGDLRINRSDYIKKQAKKAAQDTISDELKDPESELSEAIAEGGGGAGSETILISAVASYSFANNWKGYADGIICEDGSISQGHPSSVGIPLQSISVPSHDAVLALAALNDKKIENIYFPITFSVNGDDMYGQFQGTAYWDDKTSERVSGSAGNVIQIKRMMPSTLSAYTSSVKHYIGPFPMPYVDNEMRYKYFRRQAKGWGMV